ncbi:MAG TPA: TetR/AcrR family transcriptional regulator [Acidimicrobiales bacterium]
MTLDTLRTTTPAPPSKGERTRQALLEAAILRFSADGLRGVALSDVARDVGVTPAAVYAYFPGKEALFTAAVDADADALVEVALDAVERGRFTGDWGELIQLLLDSLPDHPLARRVLSGLEPESTERLLDIPALARLRAQLAELIASDQDDGAVRGDVDPTPLADGLVTIVLALLIGVLQTGGRPQPERAPGVIAVFEAALRPPR